MFCVNCGAQLPENSRFCNICGTNLSTGIASPTQGAATAGGYSQVQPGGYAQQDGFGASQGYPQQGGFVNSNSSDLVMDAGKVTFYNSEKALSIGGTGKMKIYSDRIEFKVTTGSQAAFALGPVIGAAMMHKDKGKMNVYYFNQIRNARIAKHMGLMKKVVIEFMDGKTCAFTPAERGSKTNEEAEKLCSTIKSYIR